MISYQNMNDDSFSNSCIVKSPSLKSFPLANSTKSRLLLFWNDLLFWKCHFSTVEGDEFLFPVCFCNISPLCTHIKIRQIGTSSLHSIHADFYKETLGHIYKVSTSRWCMTHLSCSKRWHWFLNEKEETRLHKSIRYTITWKKLDIPLHERNFRKVV